MVDIMVRWTGDMQFLGESLSTGHSLVMDAGSDLGGRSSGLRPMHLLIIGLGGCTGMDVVSIMKKKRQNLTGLTINIKGEQAAEDPHIYTHVSVEYVFAGRELSEAAVERSVRLSEEKYCSVMATLRPQTEIDIKWRIKDSSEQITG